MLSTSLTIEGISRKFSVSEPDVSAVDLTAKPVYGSELAGSQGSDYTVSQWFADRGE